MVHRIHFTGQDLARTRLADGHLDTTPEVTRKAKPPS
jgi:hypothetical protein